MLIGLFSLFTMTTYFTAVNGNAVFTVFTAVFTAVYGNAVLLHEQEVSFQLFGSTSIFFL